MKHRLIPLFLAGALALGTSACGPAQTRPTPAASPAPEASAAPTPTPTSAPEGLEKAELLVGLLYPGDVSDQGYTRSLSAGADEMAQALGLEEGQIRERYNVGTEEDAAQAAQALADTGCRIVFSTSPFFGEEVIQAAQDNPEVQFCQLAGGIWEETGSTPENFHRYYPAVHEGRYLAGIAAGEKAKELGNPRLGYVAPEACAEVISGFTAFYLGAKSVYPEVVMDVVYTGAWEDAAQDSQAAKTLVNRGCGVLGQHTDSTGAATMAEQLGAFYVGFGSDQSGHAPGAALLSAGVNWGLYFTQAAQGLLDGSGVPEEWNLGWAEGALYLTTLNDALAAPGTQEALDEAQAALKAGTLHVFSGPIQWTDAQGEAFEIGEGAWYDECAEGCAPTFDHIIEGITVLQG